jgi:hypothetical protein
MPPPSPFPFSFLLPCLSPGLSSLLSFCRRLEAGAGSDLDEVALARRSPAADDVARQGTDALALVLPQGADAL